MQAMSIVEQHAEQHPDFAALLSDLLGALEHHREFDLSRLYEAPYGDFRLLIDVLEAWRLQRFREDVLSAFRTR